MSEQRNSSVVDVVIPARDCAGPLASVLARMPARSVRSVVVVDNDSSDSTAQVGRDAGAVVLHEPRVGYGAACRRALSHLEALPVPPNVVVFMSGDGSDDPTELPRFLAPIAEDSVELVLGVREEAAARRPRERVVLGLIGALYRHRFADLGSYRAIQFPALVALAMSDRGSGWNVEMQVKALRYGLRIAEVALGAPGAGWRPALRRSIGRALTDSVETTGRMLFQILRHATAR